MLKISWVQTITEEAVLGQIHKPLELLVTIKERKIGYMGHVMRGEKYELFMLIVEGKIQAFALNYSNRSNYRFHT